MGTASEKPPPPGNCPLLVFMSRGTAEEDQTILSFSDRVKSDSLQIRELLGKQFWVSSPSGWCLFSDDKNGGEFFLWNSLMLAKILLPNLHIKEQHLVPVLLGSPEEPDFKVLLFSTSTPLVNLCQVGARNWWVIVYSSELLRCFGDESNRLEELIRLCHPIGYDRKLYFLSIRPKGKCFIMEGFDSGRIVIRLLDIDKPVIPHSNSNVEEFPVESDGLILLVSVHLDLNVEVKSVLVHRLDLSEMRWVKVIGAPHLAFFLAYNSAICCQASQIGIEGNCVYFPLYDKDDFDHPVRVRKYDIGDMTVSVLPLETSEGLPYDSVFWIMCDHRLIDQSEQIQNEYIVSKEVQVNVHAQGRESQWNKLLEEEVARKRFKCDLRPDVALGQALGNYLSPVEYLQFRATCKSCRSEFALAKFKESLPSNLKNGSSPLPFLMFLEPDNLGAFIDPIRGDKYLMTLPPELFGCAIVHSSDGILLMHGHGPNRVFLFNPFAGKLLLFTQAQVGEFNAYCAGFSSNPSSDYSIVAASKVNDQVHVTVACSSEKQVPDYKFADNSSFIICDNNPLFYDGAFHFLGEDGVLGVLRPESDSFTWNVHEPSDKISYYEQKFLLECEGNLISVFVSYIQNRVRVYRWNHSKSTWVKVHNLGNQMIFVSKSSAFSMIAKDHGMGNKVYLPSFYGQNIVFYSLHTKTFHTFGGKIYEIGYARERLQSCWITPSYSTAP